MCRSSLCTTSAATSPRVPGVPRRAPFLALCMSGGNTLIVDVRDYTDFALLGATRDDAAGECSDKAARVLGLPYPGGAAMDKLAHESEGGVYELRARLTEYPLDTRLFRASRPPS